MNIIRSILSDTQLRELISQGKLIESPIKEEQYQPNSIDLTLSNQFCYLEANDYNEEDGDYIDIGKPIEYELFHFSKQYGGIEYEVIDPGEFLLMSTNEILNIPNGYVGFICGRSSIARIGLQTEQAGFIDAGFRGTLTLEVYNQTKFPIKLYKDMRICQVYFMPCALSEKTYQDKNNKYQDQIEATGSKIYLDFK